MSKYLLSGLSGVALLLLVSTPVSAFNFPGMHWPQMPSGPEIENEADIENDVKVSANSGDNFQMTFGKVSLGSGGTGGVLGENLMMTGDATGYASINNMANIGDDCGCLPGSETENEADIENDVEVGASTGFNFQKTFGEVSLKPTMMIQFKRHHHSPTVPSGEASVVGSNSLQTGAAVAGAEIWNLANSSYAMVE